ncbi:type II toxin-antitoxin system YhaV family toxin [Microcystis aeruginosa]|uniref:type II toxin-antitoxin system YhaV family toxin n=1 Tax=Microcystis aeruginosa TaxID=1126 RepID=UPI002286037C|nr:type II toxin-antitoxin system YhaV family toxin [Microcystis aeruginosa]
MSIDQPLVNVWSIFAQPLFLEQFEELVTQIEELHHKFPQDYKRKNATKRLAAIAKLAFDTKYLSKINYTYLTPPCLLPFAFLH